ncbi:MAG TPA: hypothetical protein VF813_03905 [Anaerolineaceae bacterium]
MDQSNWSWADLKANQLGVLKEAESTLGVEDLTLLAYQQGSRQIIQPEKISQNRLTSARLNPSQVECLEGLENKIGSVVVAYKIS